MGEPSEVILEKRYPVLGGGFFLAGRVSGELKEQLEHLRLASELVRRATIATYEAEMNIVIHAISGEIMVSVDGNQVEVTVVDRGPGIADLEAALRPGFSTASEKARAMGFGAGLGLTNMRRCADEFHISSELGCGTRIEMRFRARTTLAKDGETDDRSGAGEVT